MNPATRQITDIGPFDAGGGTSPTITDLAVNLAGDIWVNSEVAIYKAKLPSGTGPVQLTKVTNIAAKSGQRFYALAFTPAGVLGADEKLVAGDNAGELSAIESNGATTNLGAFGTDANGKNYELSGNLTFYMQNGKARGLGTVRLCEPERALRIDLQRHARRGRRDGHERSVREQDPGQPEEAIRGLGQRLRAALRHRRVERQRLRLRAHGVDDAGAARHHRLRREGHADQDLPQPHGGLVRRRRHDGRNGDNPPAELTRFVTPAG